MRADLSAVTISSPGRRVDLLLPNGVPMLELTPTLAELCGLPGDDARPPAWTLARVGQAPFTLTSSLGESGVLDGEVLHLVDLSAWDDPKVGDADQAPEEPSGVDGWRSRGAPALVAAGGAACLAAAGLCAAALPGVRTAAGPALLAAAAALVTTAHIVGRRAAALAYGAIALAAGAGWSLTSGRGIAFAVLGATLVAGAAVVAAVPLLGPAVPGVGLVLGAVAAGAGCAAAGLRPAAATAVVAVAAGYGLRLAPGLVSRYLHAGAEPTRRWLTSIVVGCVVVAVGAVGVLVAVGDVFGLALGGAVGASLFLRGATFRYAREALAPMLGAILILVVVEVGLTVGPLTKSGLEGAGVLGLILTGTAAVLLTARPAKGIREPGRWWAVLDTCTAPLLLGALGVITGLGQWAGHLFG